MDLFDKAIELAKTDWRDLFAKAGFGQPGDHLKSYNSFENKHNIIGLQRTARSVRPQRPAVGNQKRVQQVTVDRVIHI